MPTATTEQATPTAHELRYDLAGRHGGNDLRNATKVHWKSATFSTWPEAVAELAAGIVVTVQCNHTPNRSGWAKHQIRFGPDGGIDLLSHPGFVLDVDAEMMLAGLGGGMNSCVATAIYLPLGQLVPQSHRTGNHQAINTRLRALYSAVAWAQVPGHRWTPEFGATYLRYGITPATVDRWVADGWEPQTALRFQQAFATLAKANEWRAAGNTTARAAKLAGRGESPDEEHRWAAVGFTPARSAKWRAWDYTPAEAFEWDQFNVSPSMVGSIKRAAAQPGGHPVETVKAWCAAGVPSTDVLSWITDTGGDLDEALRWKPTGLKPWEYRAVCEWNTRHPDQWLAPDLVKPYLRAKMPPKNPELIAFAVGSGIAADQYRQTVLGLRTGDSAALLAALAAHEPDEATAWWFTFTQGNLDHYSLRSLENGTSPAVTRVVLRWLRDQRFAGR